MLSLKIRIFTEPEARYRDTHFFFFFGGGGGGGGSCAFEQLDRTPNRKYALVEKKKNIYQTIVIQHNQ